MTYLNILLRRLPFAAQNEQDVPVGTLHDGILRVVLCRVEISSDVQSWLWLHTTTLTLHDVVRAGAGDASARDAREAHLQRARAVRGVDRRCEAVDGAREDALAEIRHIDGAVGLDEDVSGGVRRRFREKYRPTLAL